MLTREQSLCLKQAYYINLLRRWYLFIWEIFHGNENVFNTIKLPYTETQKMIHIIDFK